LSSHWLCTAPVDAGTDTNNKCDVDNLASPDNVHYIPGTNTLVVCEDTTSGRQPLPWACGSLQPISKRLCNSDIVPWQQPLQQLLLCNTAGHQNDVAWLYNVKTGRPSALQCMFSLASLDCPPAPQMGAAWL
jgi:hypothetical protein